MIQSNIAGLSQVLNKINDRLTKIETARPARVIGGLNVRATQSMGDWIINVDPAGDSAVIASPSTCPLDIMLEKVAPDAESWDVSVRLGTIGGFAPDNWHYIDTIDGTKTEFLVAKITASEKSITTVTLQLSSTADGCMKTMEGNPPSEFEILIGALIKQEKPSGADAVQPAPRIVRTIGCGSVSVVPLMVGENCWTWELGSI
jgi:hypothetical protein